MARGGGQAKGCAKSARIPGKKGNGKRIYPLFLPREKKEKRKRERKTAGKENEKGDLSVFRFLVRAAA